MTTRQRRRGRRAVWWMEIGLAYALLLRVQPGARQGSGVGPRGAARTRRKLIEWEHRSASTTSTRSSRSIIANDKMVLALNTFYGLAHFVVTPAVAVFLFRKRSDAYRLWRNVLAWTTGLALIGYSCSR